MPLLIFSGVALFIAVFVLFWLFYGIAALMFHPNEDSLKKLWKLSSALAIAILIFIFTVFFTNFFFARTGSFDLQFTFSDIAIQIGDWLTMSF